MNLFFTLTNEIIKLKYIHRILYLIFDKFYRNNLNPKKKKKKKKKKIIN